MRSWIICSPLVQELPCLVINQDIVADLIGEKNNMPALRCHNSVTVIHRSLFPPTLPQPGTSRYRKSPCPNRGVFAERIPGKPATTPAMLADFKNDRRLVEDMPDHDRESATEARPTRAIFFFLKKKSQKYGIGISRPRWRR